MIVPKVEDVCPGCNMLNLCNYSAKYFKCTFSLFFLYRFATLCDFQFQVCSKRCIHVWSCKLRTKINELAAKHLTDTQKLHIQSTCQLIK